MIKRYIPGLSGILPRLPEDLSAQLFAGAPARHLEAGEALFVAGDIGEGCYRLEQGLVKVMITSPRGEDRILALLGPGAIVGELSVIDRGARSASVVAIKECNLSFVSHAAFEQCTQQRPETRGGALRYCAAAGRSRAVCLRRGLSQSGRRRAA